MKTKTRNDYYALIRQTCLQWGLGKPVRIGQVSDAMYEFDIYRNNPNHKILKQHFMYDIKHGSMKLVAEKIVRS